MNKKWKAGISAVLVLILIWGILLAVDCRAVMNLQDPVIAQHTGVEGGTYTGPGWTVEIEKIHETIDGMDMGWRTVSAELYLFGILIAAAIT